MLTEKRHEIGSGPLIEHRVQVADHSVFYRYRDDLAPAGRPPVVLTHGFMASGAFFEPFMQHFARFFPVYAPDLPGYGKSSKPKGGLDVKEHAKTLKGFIDALGLEEVNLVGDSLGCAVATEFAANQPDRVKRLVMQGPTMEPEGRDGLESLMRGLRSLRLAAGTPFEAMWWNDYKEAGVKRAIDTWRFAISDRIEKRLPRIRCPTMVVHGELDPIVSSRWVNEVTRLLPDGRLVVIPDADHVLVYLQPERFCETVLPFLSGGVPYEEALR